MSTFHTQAHRHQVIFIMLDYRDNTVASLKGSKTTLLKAIFFGTLRHAQKAMYPTACGGRGAAVRSVNASRPQAHHLSQNKECGKGKEPKWCSDLERECGWLIFY